MGNSESAEAATIDTQQDSASQERVTSLPHLPEHAEMTETARLEELLHQRAVEVSALAKEADRLRRLVRELSQRLEALPVPSPELTQEQLHAAYQAAVNRAMQAEAARAALGFRLDEVSVHDVEAGDHAQKLELHEAHLTGSIRGLRAALVDVEEARDTAQARLLLVEDDLQQARRTISDLQRQLFEADEEQELLRLRATSADEAAQLRGRLEAVQRDATAQGAAAEAETQQLRTLLEQVRSDLVALRGSRSQVESTTPRASASLTTAVGNMDSSAPIAAVTTSPAPPATARKPGDSRLAERLARSEFLVRTLQGELSSERDERSEERRMAERELVAQSATCDALRDELEQFKLKRAETARMARVLLSLVPANDPLASRLGELLASLDG